MVLQGLKWAREGHDVHVVSSSPYSLAISIMIQHQLKITLSTGSTAKSTQGTVKLHEYDLRNNEANEAVSELLSAVKRDKLCVLMDEAYVSSR